MTFKNLELYSGDLPTDGEWHSTWHNIAEGVYIYQTRLWIGAARDHRGDLLNALFLNHVDGRSPDLIDVLPWDHYVEGSIGPQLSDFYPFYFWAEPGSTLEMRARGATFGNPALFLASAHIKYTNGVTT
jgi:hypothetical protein